MEPLSPQEEEAVRLPFFCLSRDETPRVGLTGSPAKSAHLQSRLTCEVAAHLQSLFYLPNTVPREHYLS